MSMSSFNRARRKRAELTGAPDAFDPADFFEREAAAAKQAELNRTRVLTDEEREAMNNVHLLDENTNPPSAPELTQNAIFKREHEALEMAYENRENFVTQNEADALSNAHKVKETTITVPNPDKEDVERANQGKRNTRHPTETSITETLQFGPDGGPSVTTKRRKSADAEAAKVEKEETLGKDDLLSAEADMPEQSELVKEAVKAQEAHDSKEPKDSKPHADVPAAKKTPAKKPAAE